MNIDGPEGRLEARYDAPSQAARAQAVLCHPHPAYGGSMHDAVLARLTGVLLGTGTAVVRFNFRGVGASEGRYDGNGGEVFDLLAAVAWSRDRHPGQALWVGGYSFGAWVAWQALGQGLVPDRMVLVAPPVGRMRFDPHTCPCPVDVLVGDDDEFVDPRALAAWQAVTTHSIPAADHFFTGQLDTLADGLRGLLT